MNTLDYETEGIVGNPIYDPPLPVGCAIRLHGASESHYYAWGHPTGNNCSFEDGRAHVLNAMRDQDWLGHNSQFEVAVTRKWLGYQDPNPLHVHDTMFQLFLTEPYAHSFSLKPSAERILGLAPEEQDEVRDWILSNVQGATTSKESPMYWAAHICKAPGELVGRYARGDTDRTHLLSEHLWPIIQERGLEPAYQREQRLAPILSESSRHGVRVDTHRLEEDVAVYRAAQRLAEEYIHSRIGVVNLGKKEQLADALDAAGLVTEWKYTPTGRRSTSRANLLHGVKDKDLINAMAYYGILETCIGTFGDSWLRQAKHDGRLHAQWNQVRADQGAGGDMSGTRTGRLSCRNPNLTNIPNNFEGVVVPEFIRQFIDEQGKLLDRTVAYIMNMRVYLLPEEGHVWLKRDFSAQEMRIMAHFAEGKLYEAFKADPKTDPHDAVQKLILEYIGIELPRKYVKITGFGILYGRGAASTAAALGVPFEEGVKVRNAYFAALPEVKDLSAATRSRGGRGLAIKTWGGRIYYREPNPDRDLSYKLLNYLIQGSAADQTKQALIDWDTGKAASVKMLAAVHDEINVSAPVEHADRDMAWLREAMDAPRFDVPFASEGYAGINWADIESTE